MNPCLQIGLFCSLLTTLSLWAEDLPKVVKQALDLPSFKAEWQATTTWPPLTPTQLDKRESQWDRFIQMVLNESGRESMERFKVLQLDSLSKESHSLTTIKASVITPTNFSVKKTSHRPIHVFSPVSFPASLKLKTANNGWITEKAEYHLIGNRFFYQVDDSGTISTDGDFGKLRNFSTIPGLDDILPILAFRNLLRNYPNRIEGESENGNEVKLVCLRQANSRVEAFFQQQPRPRLKSFKHFDGQTLIAEWSVFYLKPDNHLHRQIPTEFNIRQWDIDGQPLSTTKITTTSLSEIEGLPVRTVYAPENHTLFDRHGNLLEQFRK